MGRCGVARLQMKFGHMDGMHCIIDGTSVLVKIKSVALCNCQTVYVGNLYSARSFTVFGIIMYFFVAVFPSFAEINFIHCAVPYMYACMCVSCSFLLPVCYMLFRRRTMNGKQMQSRKS